MCTHRVSETFNSKLYKGAYLSVTTHTAATSTLVLDEQKSLANAKINARQHCVSLSCLCNSLTQSEWASETTTFLFDAPYLPNPCKYLHNPYIARNYIHQTTFPLLTVWVYLRKTGSERQACNVIECIMAVQCHPRSLIFTPIESSLSTSY